ncbi:MAG: CDP-alcohol phosphatidyltransferase family protein [Gemmatimonadaceae bacterium]
MKPPTASAPDPPAPVALAPPRPAAGRDPALASKGREVEEWLDLRFFRPVGVRIARRLAPTRVSPDQVTLWSLAVGLAAGHCFAYASPWVNASGVALFVVSDLFDSADGQLARLRGTFTRFGRTVDGLSDNARFANLYAHLVWRLVHHGGWGVAPALALAVAAGLSHSWQSAAVDCIRQAFLELGVGAGSELELPEDLAGEDAPRPGILARVARGAYRAYVRRQTWLCPATAALVRRVRALEGAGAREAARVERARAAYRARARGVVRQSAWLGQNIRFALVGVPAVLGWPAGFLWLTLLPLNAVLVALVRTQERRAARLLAGEVSRAG